MKETCEKVTYYYPESKDSLSYERRSVKDHLFIPESKDSLSYERGSEMPPIYPGITRFPIL